jgi:uncharacterized protein (DUF433 family)
MTTTTLKNVEMAIAGLSLFEKDKLLKKLSIELKGKFIGIEKTPKVMGGSACVRQTRIAVWILENARRQNVSEADLLLNYPSLNANDLVNAWDYVNLNFEEIENDIADNEGDD